MNSYYRSLVLKLVIFIYGNFTAVVVLSFLFYDQASDSSRISARPFLTGSFKFDCCTLFDALHLYDCLVISSLSQFLVTSAEELFQEISSLVSKLLRLTPAYDAFVEYRSLAFLL